MNKTLKTISLGILAIILTIFLLGYPIIISTFLLYEVRFIIRVGLYIVIGIAIVSLVGLLISHIIQAIKNKIKRGD